MLSLLVLTLQVDDLEEQEFKVESVHFHENYNVGLYLNNDIAVVKLAPNENGRGVTFGDRVVPACLPVNFKISILDIMETFLDII